eukprot:gnl/MRDRNA2_/MRDRNA2_18806_c0_seq1.p1 gnl/MRDRNA2_/MRDRNA2_18806_c0~~gnl/MRDRNA2_/MRDRNA2_18806_c0_seq1.p1  ORF type:complete len:1053 (-),score=150.93 gnl/MRDRNA2_/MRDRNA2_18806_c0_seq1:78-2798(-)
MHALRREDFLTVVKRFPAERSYYNNENRQPKILAVADIPIFHGCDDGFLRMMSSRLHHRVYFPEQTLVKEGQTGDTCFFLNSGSVMVEIGGRHVTDLPLGSVFGELAALGINPRRNATIIAKKICHTCILHRCVLQAALETFPKEQQRFADLVTLRWTSRSKLTAQSLRHVEFFRKCSEKFLDLLGESLSERLYMRGQKIVTENTISESIYIVINGCCDVLMSGQSVAVLREGSVFGEMAALGYSEKTTATVIAKEICFIGLLHRAVVLSALEHCPDEMDMFLSIAQLRAGKCREVMTKTKPQLSSYSFFEGCSPYFLEMIQQSLQEKLFLPGEKIVKEGTEGDTCYILHQGKAEAVRGEIHLTNFAPGSIFGEFSILGLSTHREATVKSQTVCLVEQLTREALWTALDEYPEEAKIFEGLVLRHLEGTVHPTMLRLPFFSGCDHRVITMLTLHAQRAVLLPKEWIVTDRTPAEALYIVNRGIVDVMKNETMVASICAGQYFGATAVLGLHRVYPLGYRTRTMCHVIAFNRLDFQAAVQRYKLPQSWLIACREREEAQLDMEKRMIHERLVQARMQQHIKRHLGRLFPPGQDRPTLGMELPDVLLRKTFESWSQLTRENRNRRKIHQRLKAVTKGNLPTVGGSMNETPPLKKTKWAALKTKHAVIRGLCRHDSEKVKDSTKYDSAASANSSRDHDETRSCYSPSTTTESQSLTSTMEAGDQKSLQSTGSSVLGNVDEESRSQMFRLPYIPGAETASSPGADASSSRAQSPLGEGELMDDSQKNDMGIPLVDMLNMHKKEVQELVAGKDEDEDGMLMSTSVKMMLFNQERPPTTEAWDGWRRRAQWLFACQDTNVLYGKNPCSWQTSYAVKKCPGIPPLPELPYIPQTRSRPATEVGGRRVVPATVR